MHNNINLLTDYIKQQAEILLLNTGEFFPFGVYINEQNHLIPIAAYLDEANDQSSSLDLIGLLERFLSESIKDGQCLAGAIAIDISLTENSVNHNAIQIRVFEFNGNTYQLNSKYVFDDGHLIFT